MSLLQKNVKIIKSIIIHQIFSGVKKDANSSVFFFVLATPIGIEPTIFSVTGRHVNRYTTGPFVCVKQQSFNYILNPAFLQKQKKQLVQKMLRINNFSYFVSSDFA